MAPQPLACAHAIEHQEIQRTHACRPPLLTRRPPTFPAGTPTCTSGTAPSA